MTKLEISPNQLDEWKKDPQTGKPNPKSISEAMSMKPAIDNGLYKNAMRPDLKKGEPNLDFKVIQNDDSFGWLDIKTPIAPIFNSVSYQARAIAEKTNLYNGNTEVLRNVHEITSATKPDRFWKPVRFDSTYREIISCTFLIDLKNLQQTSDKAQFATDLHQNINADKLKKVFIINN